jgi:hypothetical protein
MVATASSPNTSPNWRTPAESRDRLSAVAETTRLVDTLAAANCRRADLNPCADVSLDLRSEDAIGDACVPQSSPKGP